MNQYGPVRMTPPIPEIRCKEDHNTRGGTLTRHDWALATNMMEEKPGDGSTVLTKSGHCPKRAGAREPIAAMRWIRNPTRWTRAERRRMPALRTATALVIFALAALTAAVPADAAMPQGSLQIHGGASVGAVLRADASGITDADGGVTAVSFHWRRVVVARIRGKLYARMVCPDIDCDDLATGETYLLTFHRSRPWPSAVSVSLVAVHSSAAGLGRVRAFIGLRRRISEASCCFVVRRRSASGSCCTPVSADGAATMLGLGGCTPRRLRPA